MFSGIARGSIVYVLFIMKFYSRLCSSPNNVVSQCFNWFLYSNEFRDLCRKCDVVIQPTHLKFNCF